MIYCVEDDREIRELMIYTLKASGFEARGFASGEEMFECLGGKHSPGREHSPGGGQAQAENRPRLILLDIMLPGQDGIAILEKLRSDEATADVPVIMASAKGAEYDKVRGLDLGADDYLAKPFGMMEMIARVRAVLRRSGEPEEEKTEISNGEITMNDSDHEVRIDGSPISLTLKEYEILRLFLENPGKVFTREQLLNSIWGLDYLGESRTVDVHIGTLRNKLGQAGESIETIRGIGYRMEKQS